METLRNNQEEILEIKNTVTGIKDAIAKFNSRLDTAMHRISKSEDRSIEVSQTEMHRGKNNLKNKQATKNKTSNNRKAISKDITYP